MSSKATRTMQRDIERRIPTLLRGTYEYVRLEVRRTLRERSYLVFTVGLPVLLYLLFSDLGDGDTDDVKTSLMVGMAAYGGIGAALGNGSTIAEDKQLGWLRQLRITPLTSAQVVGGRLVTGLIVVLPAIAAVLAAGALFNDVTLSGPQWATITLLLWLGTAPFCLLGLGNGYRFDGNTANLANLSCSILLAVGGGLWLPADDFPDWLAELAKWTPAHGYGELSWSVTDGHAPGTVPLVSFTAWLAIFGAWAIHAYRRPSRGA
ncbi:ABC transporter permease [Streptomyces sp. NPDC059679]|uniref:ABC transporter permease n=1 Tax=Streptomyces sp. NPDC059679 TaxID=3346903 RepID=UPI0036889B09